MCFRTDGVDWVCAFGESKASLFLRLDGDFARSFTADDLLIPAGALPPGVGVTDLMVAMLDLVAVRSRSTLVREGDSSRVIVTEIEAADGIGESANPTCR